MSDYKEKFEKMKVAGDLAARTLEPIIFSSNSKYEIF